jgi:hypothetical protein
MTRARFRAEFRWLLCLSLGLGACQTCSNKISSTASGSISPTAGGAPRVAVSSSLDTADGSVRLGTIFAQCNDAALGIDPNNCGGCGTICGTYVNQLGKGFSFVSGQCIQPDGRALGYCSPVYSATPSSVSNYQQIAATTADDCYGFASAGSVVNTTAFDAKMVAIPDAHYGCINIMTDINNCGSLGHVCPLNGFCTFGQCH